MNRSLQQFLNLVLAPLDELGYGRIKVGIEFNILPLLRREFTNRVLAKEKRSLTASPHHHFQTLEGSLREIKETVQNFFTLLDSESTTQIGQQHLQLLDPMVTEVVQAIKNLRNSKRSF